MSETRGAVSAMFGDDFDALEAVGGVRGIVESSLPTLVFLIAYLVWGVNIALWLSLALAVLFIAVRALTRIPIAPAVGGFCAAAISAALTWHTGEASNFFLWGLLTNAAYFLAFAVSLLVRRPLAGFLIGAFRGELTGWWARPDVTRRRYTQVTALFTALFGIRMAVQVPLYLAGATSALGVAKLLMGFPLFAVLVWLSWMLVHDLPAVSDAGTPDETPAASTN
ncbi:hypothetical protein J2S49_000229 [Arcanobacterium wilhelmae]|uniref:DUF3159 domain-containing protein n=1 Tax=Arcanobacterium wilhelmae TaxID=1803177 RepID=A0ABT9N8X5_9ACTO|nr:DUF3159 domain-containing protein [Arcanobacterium wilhelmae]MDP9800153.1 hypothetical protein [Arcanobacterium wilhelmae]WFN89593.1 DUF3159 domain-containing protein [Arcanobacterium wilhelmae]